MKCRYACGTSDHRIARRTFLGLTGVGAMTGFGSFTRSSVAAEMQRQKKQILLVYLAGGVSQLESWDPKPGTDTGGPFRAIPTSVPGIHISELLPYTAKQMHHLSLVRGINIKENNHGKGAYFMQTGRRETPGQEFPHLGSLSSMLLGGEADSLPGYIHITPKGGANRKDAAFLGAKYAPVALAGDKPPANTARLGSLDAVADERRNADNDDYKIPARAFGTSYADVLRGTLA